MNRIIVVCACDNNYACYCGIMLTSVFENNKSNHIVVYILTDYIDNGNTQKLQNLAQRYGQELRIIDIDKSLFNKYPIGQRFKNYISLCTYYRLLIPSILEYSKVIYLDCDIIVRADLGELWEVDVNGFAFGAVKDMTYTIETSVPRLGYDSKNSYYNAGVCLFNVDYLRSFDFDNKVSEYMNKYSERIVYHDQDILNAVCHGHYKDISIKWNMMEPFLKKNPQCDSTNLEELHKYQSAPAIIHYTSTIKPWFVECKHIYRQEFWKYVAKSPWNELKPQKKFKTTLEKLRYNIIQILLQIRDFKQLGKYQFIDEKLQSYRLM